MSRPETTLPAQLVTKYHHNPININNIVL